MNPKALPMMSRPNRQRVGGQKGTATLLTDAKTPQQLRDEIVVAVAMYRIAATNDAGRAIGEGHHRARLSDADCWLIEDLHAEGLTYREIAEKFECSRHTVESICTGRRRAHLPVGQKPVRTPRT